MRRSSERAGEALTATIREHHHIGTIGPAHQPGDPWLRPQDAQTEVRPRTPAVSSAGFCATSGRRVGSWQP